MALIHLSSGVADLQHFHHLSLQETRDLRALNRAELEKLRKKLGFQQEQQTPESLKDFQRSNNDANDNIVPLSESSQSALSRLEHFEVLLGHAELRKQYKIEKNGGDGRESEENPAR